MRTRPLANPGDETPRLAEFVDNERELSVSREGSISRIATGADQPAACPQMGRTGRWEPASAGQRGVASQAARRARARDTRREETDDVRDGQAIRRRN